MIVVSDTSCVTNLLAIGRAVLLRELFGEVVIPSAVARELRAAHAALPDFIREQPAKNSPRAQALAIEPLDEGEAEAIVLVEELLSHHLSAPLMCCDELVPNRFVSRFSALGNGCVFFSGAVAFVFGGFRGYW